MSDERNKWGWPIFFCEFVSYCVLCSFIYLGIQNNLHYFVFYIANNRKIDFEDIRMLSKRWNVPELVLISDGYDTDSVSRYPIFPIPTLA